MPVCARLQRALDEAPGKAGRGPWLLFQIAGS